MEDGNEQLIDTCYSNTPKPKSHHHQQMHKTLSLSHLSSLGSRQKHHDHHHHFYRHTQPNHFQRHKSKMKTAFAVALALLVTVALPNKTVLANSRDPFPGVTRDLASFCAARPSLPIDVASMVVHVKRNVSFNYKLYLFSGNHVFQTGQVIPRDEFRIHSFPVKFKPLTDFWSSKVDTFQYNDSKLNSLHRVPSETFNLKQFLKPVPLNPNQSPTMAPVSRVIAKEARLDDHDDLQHRADLTEGSKLTSQQAGRLPEDLHGDSLPGDPRPASSIGRDAASVMEHHRLELLGSDDTLHPYNENYNRHIKFDRDDQLSVSRSYHSVVEEATSGEQQQSASTSSSSSASTFSDEIIPVGSFSSFHVNLTYFVRKDFGQTEPELVRAQIDPAQFLVSELIVINNGSKNSSSYPQNEDYSFLQHRLIRDPNTRITAINQIYEDWITRNFYTIVYIQRKLSQTPAEDDTSASDGELARGEQDHGGRSSEKRKQQQAMIVSDRLVFRGTSTALLGAEQLDYNVKAAAFITEKNGLHYYLEFLTTGKFYLCAVDWTKRPFKMIDSKRFPIKATRTQLDNEELLLCPPAICYSDRPVDEIVGYGRISINNFKDNLQSTDSLAPNKANVAALKAISAASNKALIGSSSDSPLLVGHPPSSSQRIDFIANNNVPFDGLGWTSPERLKMGSKQLETKLHLRDWVWTLPRRLTQLQQPLANLGSLTTKPSGWFGYNSTVRSANGANKTSFKWHYELAKRNDIKVKQDTYGYVLTGHDIDASYRIYNELYLISANHLITINYTLVNETVTSNQLLGEEFFGLSSTLIDPITGAFYDRYENQIFFFKGDRYIGYNYTTKKPLDDFVLEAPLSSMELDPIGVNLFSGGPLVSSLPVVGILGRQHEVDGVYHDYSSDFVYIFSGMKFYKFSASEFKNGTFRPNGQSLPRMHCINEHFLDGCHFDRAFPNPCSSDDTESDTRLAELLNTSGEGLSTEGHQHEHDLDNQRQPGGGGKQHAQVGEPDGNRLEVEGFRGSKSSSSDFFEEQQMKLRSIAARKPGLMNILKENSLLKAGAAFQAPAEESEQTEVEEATPVQTKTNKSQETLFVYLLVIMIILTSLVSILLIFVLVYWSRARSTGIFRGSRAQVHPFSPNFVASSNYLNNQREHQTRRAPGTTASSNAQQLAYGGRLMVSKQLSCVKVANGNSSAALDTKSNSSSDSNSVDNSAL